MTTTVNDSSVVNNLANLFIIIWVGLRGGISVAMALPLPPSMYREISLYCCYFIILFSIVVQGLMLNNVVGVPLLKMKLIA